MRYFRIRFSKFFWGGGIAPSQIPSLSLYAFSPLMAIFGSATDEDTLNVLHGFIEIDTTY